MKQIKSTEQSKRYLARQAKRKHNYTITNLANKITLTRILLVPVFILVLVSNLVYARYLALLIFILLALSDTLDGYVARKRNEVTAIGAILDPLADKLLVGAALIFLIGKGVEAWMAYVILARELIITGLRVVVSTKNNTMGAKLSGKLKTLIQIVAISAVMLNVSYAYWLMLAATIFTVYSGLEYLWIERKSLRGSF